MTKPLEYLNKIVYIVDQDNVTERGNFNSDVLWCISPLNLSNAHLVSAWMSDQAVAHDKFGVRSWIKTAAGQELQAISAFPGVFKRFTVQTHKKPWLVWVRV